MPKSLIFLAFVLVLPTIGAGQRAEPSAFLVTMGDGVTDLARDGVSTHDCILVFPDGRFHLERRRQEYLGSRVKLKIFESSVTAPQLQQLREILASEAILKLPPFVPPRLAMAVPWSEIFIAAIPRDTEIRKVGYVLWRGGTPEGSPNSSPAGVKQGWKDSEVALRPLVDWFHTFESGKLRRHGKSTLCRAPGEPDDVDSPAVYK
jgi:hypothetical protein